jgi:hypothetical protein
MTKKKEEAVKMTEKEKASHLLPFTSSRLLPFTPSRPCSKTNYEAKTYPNKNLLRPD